MQRPFLGARNLPSAANPGNPAPTLCQREAVNADDHHNLPVKVNSHNHPDELPVSRALRASAEVVRAHLRAGFLHAGRELSRAKLTCEHGEWLPYLQLCEVPTRWAQRMMQAARAIDAGEVPEDLSLNATLLAIAEKRQNPSHLPAPAPQPSGAVTFEQSLPFYALCCTLHKSGASAAGWLDWWRWSARWRNMPAADFEASLDYGAMADRPRADRQRRDDMGLALRLGFRGAVRPARA